MEIIIAAALCIWLTFFSLWAYFTVKKDLSESETDTGTKEPEERGTR
ncbi:MAG: hypothetical protein IJ106_01825 [Parasporobacterium sp.]|nr:hypothetical protein [Parasporobacterium sp.]